MLEVTENIWVEAGRLRFATQPIPTRMTVIRLRDGGLLIYSPLALTDELRTELSALGPVEHVVAPNTYHHLFAGEWLSAFPEARSYAAPGLAKKRRDLSFDEVLGDESPAAWKGQLDQLVFTALPIFNEVVMFHRDSRSLLLTDLAFNLQSAESVWARTLFRLDGMYQRFAPSRILKPFFRRGPAREQLARILAWDFERIIMAHGEILESGGPGALREAFAWL